MLIQRISLNTGLSQEYLAKVVRSASHRYKTYRIRKRTKGWRQINHPAVELKLLQVWLMDSVLNHLSIHKSVYSYRKGISIKDHAKVHEKQNYLLRVDFNDFFPSIHGEDVERVLMCNHKRLPFPLSEGDLKIVRSIVCKNDQLTIGAPSSPQVSNAVMYDFDKYWFNKGKRAKVIYSRYADDLFFSTNVPKVLEGLFDELLRDLERRNSPCLTINRKKTVFTSRRRRRMITGLVLTSDRKTSIGRVNKRRIKGMVFRYMHGELDPTDLSYLRGYLAFAKSVEPSFVHSLRKKYGSTTLRQIEKAALISRK